MPAARGAAPHATPMKKISETRVRRLGTAVVGALEWMKNDGWSRRWTLAWVLGGSCRTGMPTAVSLTGAQEDEEWPRAARLVDAARSSHS